MENRTQPHRITLTQTGTDAIVAMSNGVIGAVNVLITIAKDATKIDPANIFGHVGVFMSLDTMEIYGSDIWMLYKDVCKQDISAMLACLRGVQLGIVPEDALKHAIQNRGAGVDVADILLKVKASLPEFGS